MIIWHKIKLPRFILNNCRILLSFLFLSFFSPAGLEPLQARAEITWQLLENLSRLSLLHQVAVFRSTDVMVAAVGAALAWLVVMRPGAQVLEWLPESVPAPLSKCGVSLYGVVENANARPSHLVFLMRLGSSGGMFCFLSFGLLGRSDR